MDHRRSGPPRPTGRHPALRGGVYIPGPLADRLTDRRCLVIITVGLTALCSMTLTILLLLGILLPVVYSRWPRPAQGD
ncbi:MAG TPA: hypothetical protein VGJ13_05155 [Pseudonocardiaceae bacterium]